jgi:hypothetical protein
MRPKPFLFIVLVVSASADAHTLAADESIALQLGHQVLGLHHLPLTALLIVGGILLARQIKKISHD